MERQTTYSIEVPSTYLHLGAGQGKPLLLLAHGFADSASSFLRRALPQAHPGFEILAPNGPFPMPKRVGDEWKDAYAWYFADFRAQQIRVHPRVAAGAVARLVRELGLEARPKVLLGFSQGGYFLPHLAREVSNVRRFVTVGAGSHSEFFREFGLAAPLDAIHGTEDEIIAFAEAERDFAELPHRGAFHAVPAMTHKINDDGRAVLRRVLDGIVSLL